jgi:uncharacterized protein (TIGR02996 family)
MITEDDFQRAIDANPEDWHTRLVFADWLEEHNDPRAVGYRALGFLRRVPTYFDQAGRWVWLNTHWSAHYSNPAMSGAVLPDDWYDQLPVENEKHSDPCAAERHALRASLNDAALAFAKLPAARRAELLNRPE